MSGEGAGRDDTPDHDALDALWQSPEGWKLDQELEIAAEVYGPGRGPLREALSDLTDEELVERFRTMLGFDVA